MRRLRSRRAWRRATAAFTLGDMASERAVPELLEVLDDSQRASALPPEPTAAADVEQLLVRLRLA